MLKNIRWLKIIKLSKNSKKFLLSCKINLIYCIEIKKRFKNLIWNSTVRVLSSDGEIKNIIMIVGVVHGN